MFNCVVWCLIEYISRCSCELVFDGEGLVFVCPCV